MCESGWFFPPAGSGSPDCGKASPPAREKGLLRGNLTWALYNVFLRTPTEASHPESEPLRPVD